MRTVVRALAAFTVIALLVMSSATPSSAAVKRRADPRGDAAAQFDITTVRYANTTDTFAATIRVRDVKDVSTVAAIRFTTKDLREQGQFAVLGTARYDGGYQDGSLHVQSRDGSKRFIECPGLRYVWSLEKDTIKVSIPQECIGQQDSPLRLVTSLGVVGRPKDKTASLNVRYQ